MLSGVVNIYTDPALGVALGNMSLVGDVMGNSVKVQSAAISPSTGQYVLSSGDQTTLFRLNPATPGIGPTLTSVTVNGISGSIAVNLGPGNDAFDFEAPTVSPPALSTVLGNLSIVNGAYDANQINGVVINGNLTVTKTPATFGYASLTMNGSTVIGVTKIDNDTAGGGGDSITSIQDTILQGNGSSPGSPALTVDNGPGSNVTYVQGNSQIGTAMFVTSTTVTPAPTVVRITNGTGPSNTQFNGNSSGTAEIFGSIEVTNGNTLPLQLNQVWFNKTQVLGAVTIDDLAGGDTSVNVLSSRVGSSWIAGGPLAVTNGSGIAQFTMSTSELPWGLYLNNSPPAGSPWGSITTITSSKINNRPVFGAPALPSPALPGDAAYIGGGAGPDQVIVTGTTFFGQLNLALGAGLNNVKLDSSTMSALSLIAGTGSTTAWIGGCTIQTAMSVTLGPDADTLSLQTGSNSLPNTLPDPLLGFLKIDGGFGVDTLKHDAADAVPANTLSFEYIVIG